MSPTTRSDSLKKKVQKREAYSRSAKRSLDNEFEATTSEVQPGLKKVAKLAAKNNNKTVSLKTQKRKQFNVEIHTPKITKKPKAFEPMSPTTRSDSLKKKAHNREAYSRTAKRRLEIDSPAMTSSPL